MRAPIEVEVNPRRTARVTVPLVGDGTDARSTAALRTLRERILPATIGTLPSELRRHGRHRGLGGQQRAAQAVLAAGLRVRPDLRIPAPARLVPLARDRGQGDRAQPALRRRAYGVLVAAFQHGWAESILGFRSNGGIASWLPIFMFVILFGLSMDYHVFILSRIREAFDRGLTTEDAVAHGIMTTAGVVTSARAGDGRFFSIFVTCRSST